MTDLKDILDALIPTVQDAKGGFDTSRAWAKVDARPAGMSRDAYLDQFRSNSKQNAGKRTSYAEHDKARTDRTKTSYRQLDQTRGKRHAQIKKLQDDAARGAKHLEAPDGSSCFASLSWDSYGDGSDGIVTAEFYRGGAITYFYDVSRGDFLDWAGGSQGGWFNQSGLYDEAMS